MHERILQRFRDRIRSLDYVVTLHAEEEMDEDGLSVFDLESAVLTGEIVERQRDRGTREWKYVVNGRGLDRHCRCRWKVEPYRLSRYNHGL